MANGEKYVKKYVAYAVLLYKERNVIWDSFLTKWVQGFNITAQHLKESTHPTPHTPHTLTSTCILMI